MDWLVDLLTYSVGQLIDLLTNAVSFSAGALTGFLLGLLGAHIQRRWRRQELRATEHRARLDQLFQPLRNYAMAICEFLLHLTAHMEVWEKHRSSEHAHAYADIIREEIQNRAQRLQGLEPPLGSRIALDSEAVSRLLDLESLADTCRDRSLHCLDTKAEPDIQQFKATIAEGAAHGAHILERMTQTLDAAE